MPLQLDVHIRSPEQPDERIDEPAHAVARRPEQLPPGQRHETAGAPVEILERERAFSLWRAHLHARDEPAEVPITLLRLNEHGDAKVRTRRTARAPRTA